MPQNKKLKGPRRRSAVAIKIAGLTDAQLLQLCDGPDLGIGGGFGELKPLRYPKAMEGVSHKRFPWVTRKDHQKNLSIFTVEAKAYWSRKEAVFLYCQTETIFHGPNGDGVPWAFHAFDARDVDLSQFLKF